MKTLKKTKKDHIEDSQAENSNTYPYDVDDLIWDNYGEDYYSRDEFKNDPWYVLTGLKSEGGLYKVLHVKLAQFTQNSDKLQCLIVINTNRLAEDNVFDLIMNINFLYEDKKVTFLRIVTDKINPYKEEEYNDFTLKVNEHYMLRYANTDLDKQDFVKSFYEALAIKKLSRFQLALSI